MSEGRLFSTECENFTFYTVRYLTLIVIFLLCSFETLIAQNQLEACGNSAIPHKEMKETAEFKMLKQKVNNNSNTIVNVPIKLHIVRNNNGTTNFNTAAFFESFAELNNKFSALNIRFYFLGGVDMIDNTSLYSFEAQNEEATLCNTNDVTNAINLYYVNSILFFNGLYASGYAYYPTSSKLSNRVIIANNSLTSHRTLSHEFGHYFNLLHTYSNNSNPTLKEKVTRTNSPNCSTNGDMLCDTPADPYGLPGATMNNCTYTGTITDENNEQFSPAVNNTMSYYNPACGDQFTAMQRNRMTDGYLLRLLPTNDYEIDYVVSTVLTPTNLTATMIGSKISLNFIDNASNEVGYMIERKSNTTGQFKALKCIFENESTYLDEDLVSNTVYTYRVRALNSAVYSNEVEITTSITRCVPQYGYKCDEFPIVLEQFSILGTSLNNINSGCSPNSHSITTTNVPDLNVNQNYTLKASANTVNGTMYFSQHATIWIDYNLDGNFTPTEIIYKSTLAVPLNPEITATFKIPLTATPGLNVLRVRTQYADDGLVNDPCTLLQTGETEDYVINIKSTEVQNDIKITSFSPAMVCSGSGINVNYQKVGNNTLDSTQFILQIGDAAGLYQNLISTVSGGILMAQVPPTFPSGTYKLRIVSNSPTFVGSNATTNLTINASPNSGINLIGTISSNQTTNFTAEPQVIGANYSWNFGVDAVPGSSTTANGQVLWNTSGTKIVTLNVSKNGCEKIYTKTTEVTPASGFTAKVKILLEGMLNSSSGLMKTDLVAKQLIPKQQPFNQAPWNYGGTEEVITFDAAISDWVLIVARRNDGTVLSKKAALIRNDGVILGSDQTEGVAMGALTGEVYVSIHHKSHIAVMTSTPITNNELYDFSFTQNQTKGSAQQKLVGSKWCIFAGDFDNNCLNNNLDFNAWKLKGARLNQYLKEDADGNGIINNLDFNLWARNRSKVGVSEVRTH